MIERAENGARQSVPGESELQDAESLSALPAASPRQSVPGESELQNAESLSALPAASPRQSVPLEAASHFMLDGAPVSAEPYGEGHINETYLLVTDKAHRYILQKINDRVFNVEELMENISAVCDFISSKTDDERGVMRIVRDTEGGSYYRDETGYYRVYEFVEGSICLQAAGCPEDFYQSAKAFGNFQEMLEDFPAGILHETIPDFHNTPDRYRILKESIKRCDTESSGEEYGCATATGGIENAERKALGSEDAEHRGAEEYGCATATGGIENAERKALGSEDAEHRGAESDRAGYKSAASGRAEREILWSEDAGYDRAARKKEAEAEIAFALEREDEGGILRRMFERGELPLKVTHNDTKLNNVLLDEKTGKALCVIDLDTVMPGLSVYDFGDSIRFGAVTAGEDERDLNKLTIDLELFRIYTRGFLESCPSLTKTEIEMLPQGALVMTLECGVRFLTDYLDGDRYFSIRRKGQNLDRARAQFRLVSEMEKNMDRMKKIVAEEAAALSGR